MNKLSKRRTLFWTAALILLASALCWLVLLPALRPRGQSEIEIPLDLSQARLLLGTGPSVYSGPGSLSLRRALRDVAYLKTQTQLLLGVKLASLTSTNVTLGQCAAAFATLARCDEVAVPTDSINLPLGNFDSRRHVSRWAAAHALRRLMEDAGLQALRLTNHTLLLASQQQSELFLAAASSAKQQTLVKEFDEQKGSARKSDVAQILSTLWTAGFLTDALKRQLLEEHYHLVLEQEPLGYGAQFKVQCDPSFPFPDLQSEFKSTLYVNQVAHADAGSTTMSMIVPRRGLSASSVASLGGGWPGLRDWGIRPGTVMRYQIDFKQKVQGREWQALLWSNELAVQGPEN